MNIVLTQDFKMGIEPPSEKEKVKTLKYVRKRFALGGFGELHLLEDVNTGIRYMYKVARYMEPGFHRGTEAEVLAKNNMAVLGEAKIVKLLSRRHNIKEVPFYEKSVDEKDGRKGFVMEFVDGLGLEDMLRYMNNSGIIGNRVFNLILAKQLIGALLKIKKATGLSHRDLKPCNMIVNKRGLLKILDWGTAEESSARDSSILSPLIAPPEVLGGSPIENLEAFDAYTIGVLLHRLETGRDPFQELLTQNPYFRRIAQPTFIENLCAIPGIFADESREYNSIVNDFLNPEPEHRMGLEEGLSRIMAELGQLGYDSDHVSDREYRVTSHYTRLIHKLAANLELTDGDATTPLKTDILRKSDDPHTAFRKVSESLNPSYLWFLITHETRKRKIQPDNIGNVELSGVKTTQNMNLGTVVPIAEPKQTEIDYEQRETEALIAEYNQLRDSGRLESMVREMTQSIPPQELHQLYMGNMHNVLTVYRKAF
jgi:serine/threonine protein kinase